MKLELVAFDVNETLVSLDRVSNRLPSGAFEVWFARILRDGFALAATGRYAPFRELAASHLELVAPEADANEILGELRRLDAHPDVRPAFERLRSIGVRIVTLTNGQAETVEAILAHNQLEGYVERCFSADEVRAWKPRREPYELVAKATGVGPNRIGFVAVHSWDVHGAKLAGLQTGWCSRLEGSFGHGFLQADVFGEDLVEVVEGLLAA
ncbi:MAG: haloacid dehalogenase type II [Acidimicrobiia bacterium]